MSKNFFLIRSRPDQEWVSMEEVYPAIEQTWRALGRVETLVLDDPGQVLSAVPRVAAADGVVLPGLDSKTLTLLRVLRGNFGFLGRIIVYLHGESSLGAAPFQECWRYLTSGDRFVVSSDAEARAMRILFNNASITRIPYFLPGESVASNAKPQERRPFLYAGRISEQKNLHTLFHALKLIRDRGVDARLEICGEGDRLGSLHTGKLSIDYEPWLRELAGRLGIEEGIRWHGFVSREELHQRLSRREGVLVSPSLHWDENFGIAAFRGLCSGNPAVLSAWWGHLDLIRDFPRAVIPVPVHLTATGPAINPLLMADALLRSRNLKRRRPRYPERYSLSSITRQLRRLLKGPRGGKALDPTPLFVTLLRKRERFPRRSFQAFDSYDDPDLSLFCRVYGARAQLKQKPSALLVVPWAKVVGKYIHVTDPHRGSFEHRVAGRHAAGTMVRAIIGESEVPLPRETADWLIQCGFGWPYHRFRVLEDSR